MSAKYNGMTYQPIHDPPSNESMDEALDKLGKEDRLRVARSINSIAGFTRGFGSVSAKEFMAKLGMYMVAREKFGPDVSLTDGRVMRALLRDNEE